MNKILFLLSLVLMTMSSTINAKANAPVSSFSSKIKTTNAPNIQEKNDTIININKEMPWWRYEGYTVNDSIKQGNGVIYIDLYGYSIKGTWKNNYMQHGTGTFKRGDDVYEVTIQTDVSNKKTATVSADGKIISTELVSPTESDVDIANKLTDIVLLKERGINKNAYEKSLKGKYFYLKMPLAKYAEIFKTPIIGELFDELFDKNISVIISIIPVTENKLLFIQQPVMEGQFESYDRGYLIQQNMLSEELTDKSYYSYVIKNDCLTFKSDADFAGKMTYQLKDGMLYDNNNKVSLHSYQLEQFNKLFKKSTKKDLNIVQEEAKDKSMPENYFMTSKELKEKYKTSLSDRWSSFPGGSEAEMKFISSNTQYPITCIENGIEGVVWLKFTVTRDGDIKDIIVVKSVVPQMDKEAIRVVQQMPKWEPAVWNKQFVDCDFNLVPFKFKLD